MKLKSKIGQIRLYDRRTGRVKVWKGYSFHDNDFTDHPLAIYSMERGKWHILEKHSGCIIDKPGVRYRTKQEALDAVEDQYVMLLEMIKERPGVYEKAVERFREASNRYRGKEND